jgi:hypothetical protein
MLLNVQLIPVYINPLNAELNTICHLLASLGVHHTLHVSRIRVNICSTPYQVLFPVDLSTGWTRYPVKCEVPNARMIKYQWCSEIPERKISMFFRHISVVLLPTLKIMVASQDWWDTAKWLSGACQMKGKRWRLATPNRTVLRRQSCGLWKHVVIQVNQCSKRTCCLHLCGQSECSMHVDRSYKQDDTNCGHPETMKVERR